MPAKDYGPHIGKIHSWIQWNVVNGEYVTWGSEDQAVLKRSLTVRALENLAQEIADAVIDDPHLVTAEKIQKAWEGSDHQPFRLTVDGQYRVTLETEEGVDEYLNVKDALRRLLHRLTKTEG